MNADEIQKSIHSTLESRGHKARIVSIKRISELRDAIEKSRDEGRFDLEFYKKELTHLEFKRPKNYQKAISLIVVASPQSHVRVTFVHNGKKFPCIIPSNYSHKTDAKVEEILKGIMNPKGYFIKKAELPLKTMAVRSGLARYGRNNIAYVEGMGSFLRFVAFYSDCPLREERWEEPEVLEQCENCTACYKTCPTAAIASDRFLLRGERCLTFFNERQENFPSWIDPSWHHCLVGCILCQKVCPANKKVDIQTETGPTFSEEETKILMMDSFENELPEETFKKLEELDLTEYSTILGRNLSALL